MPAPSAPVPFELEVYGTCAGPDMWHNMGQPVVMEEDSKDERYYYQWEWTCPSTMCLIHSRIRTNGHTQHSEIEKTLPMTVFEGNTVVFTLPIMEVA